MINNRLEFYFQVKGERGIPGPTGIAVCTQLVFIIWLVPRAGNMNQILRSD